MPEEKKGSAIEPKDIFEKAIVSDLEKAGDMAEKPGVTPIASAPSAELWIDGKTEKKVEKGDEKYVSSYERKLKELQAASSTSAPATPPDDDAVKFDADAIRHMEDADGRVQKLLDLARVKGVKHAVSVAKNIDAYTLDKTHDRLVDELSDGLREQGLLKEREE